MNNMKIDNLDIDKIVKEINSDKSLLKMRRNGIYLSDMDVEVLRKYDIDYKRYNSLSSLIFDIEKVLNEETFDDLEEISKKLSEFNYYNNTNK